MIKFLAKFGVAYADTWVLFCSIIALFLLFFGWLIPFLVSAKDTLLVTVGLLLAGLIVPILLGRLTVSLGTRLRKKGNRIK